MPKAMKKSVREQSPPPSDDHNPTDSVEDSDSDHNQDPDVSFRPCGSTQSGSYHVYAYIEDQMNWTVDDGLYHRFLKWQLKCETNSRLQISKSPY